MMKLNILDMKEFFNVVNDCKGSVNLVEPDGTQENINNEYFLQKRLLEEYEENKKSLLLCLDVPDGHDYIRIVSYYAGDC